MGQARGVRRHRRALRRRLPTGPLHAPVAMALCGVSAPRPRRSDRRHPEQPSCLQRSEFRFFLDRRPDRRGAADGRRDSDADRQRRLRRGVSCRPARGFRAGGGDRDADPERPCRDDRREQRADRANGGKVRRDAGHQGQRGLCAGAGFRRPHAAPLRRCVRARQCPVRLLSQHAVPGCRLHSARQQPVPGAAGPGRKLLLGRFRDGHRLRPATDDAFHRACGRADRRSPRGFAYLDQPAERGGTVREVHQVGGMAGSRCKTWRTATMAGRSPRDST